MLDLFVYSVTLPQNGNGGHVIQHLVSFEMLTFRFFFHACGRRTYNIRNQEDSNSHNQHLQKRKDQDAWKKKTHILNPSKYSSQDIQGTHKAFKATRTIPMHTWSLCRFETEVCSTKTRFWQRDLGRFRLRATHFTVIISLNDRCFSCPGVPCFWWN